MEKKRTQRIIGILVVIALIVIVMPLLFGRNDSPTEEASNIKAPPFPDQQTAPVTASNTTTPDATPAENAVNTDAASPNPNNDVAVNNTNASATQPNQAGDMPSDTSAAATPEAAQPAPTPDVNKIDSPVATPTDPSANTATTNVDKKAANVANMTPDVQKDKNAANESGIIYERPKEAEPVKTTAPVATTAPTPTPDAAPKEVAPALVQAQKPDEQSVSGLKLKPAVMHTPHTHKAIKSVIAKNKKTLDQFSKEKTAWAVQMGSFKVKQNAIMLANKLRKAGYKVFTHEVKSAKGNVSTRVYIGPEHQLASAAKLSNDIHQHLNMQGFVIPYKPLEI